MEDYKEKLRLAKEALDSGSYDKETIEYIFPELKDSEDDVMRKMAIKAVYAPEAQSCIKSWGINPEDVVAWLEKQGEQKPIFRVGDYIRNTTTGDEVLIEQLDLATKAYCYVSYDGAAVNHSDFPFVKQNEWELIEQKVVEQNHPDKAEPKFKVGDWCIDTEDNTTFQITNVLSNLYYYRTNEGKEYACTQDSIERDAHLWTIQDAKDGDVIFSNDGHGSDSIELIKSIYDKRINFWFCLSSKNNFKDYHYEVYNGNIPYTNFASRKGATPATQEQRDLLFAEMKEAGYEWDAKKKELKKIEQKPTFPKFRVGDRIKCKHDDRQFKIKSVDSDKGTYTYTQEGCGNDIDYADEEFELVEQNPAWSEEDANKLSTVLFILHEYKNYNFDRWLKSLKERYTWKPSDEQMEALSNALGLAKSCGEESSYDLRTLYEQLKKLREE